MRPRPTMPSVLPGDLLAHELLAVPSAFDERLVRGRDVAAHREHQGDGVLGRAGRVAGRRVHHDDAGPRGGRLVDVVGADAGSDDRLEAGVAFEHLGRELHAAAADGPVELRQRGLQVVALESGADFVRDPLGGLEQVEPLLGEVVENNDAGHRSGFRLEATGKVVSRRRKPTGAKISRRSRYGSRPGSRGEPRRPRAASRCRSTPGRRRRSGAP